MQLKNLAAGLAGAVALGVLAFSAAPANAQVPYLGVDFGNGFGNAFGQNGDVFSGRCAVA